MKNRNYVVVKSKDTLWIERVKLIVTGFLVICVMIGLQTTILARIKLFLLQSSYPSLSLLFTLSVGFFTTEREGAVCGLVAGFLTDASMHTGMMVLPLFFMLCGFICGIASQYMLAHNLPSFMVYASVACIFEALVIIFITMLEMRSIPSSKLLTNYLVPHYIITMLFSPLVYFMSKGLSRLLLKEQ